MKVIFLYGPPGAGKLTIGRLLSKKTGFPLLHNQLTIDLLADFFQFETKVFSRINKKIRHAILAAYLATQPRGLIMTYAWALSHANDRRDVRKYRQTVRNAGGTMYFVELRCDQRTLLRRVKLASRAKYKKIRTKGKLVQLLQRYEFTSEHFPHGLGRTFVFDTTRVPARKTADRIARALRLGI